MPTPERDRDPQLNPIDQDRYRHAEAELGGADSVEKTTYAGNAHGAEPGDAPWQNREVTAQVASRGNSATLWITGILAALALIGYALGFFS